jgi:eukaryotic-like serine/threonine-protein kinase
MPITLPDIAGHELLELIGTGCCGSVYRGRTAEGQECAVKVFSSMAINRKALQVTSQTLAALPKHESVVVPLAYGFDKSPCYCAVPLLGKSEKRPDGKKHWQVQTLEDWCEEGEPAKQAWEIIYRLADALAWLHREGLPHGNLRPCNVLVEEVDGEVMVRLTDMGQGWVGGIHHLDLGDHFVYLCPDQAENPNGVFAGYGLSWDVYIFGVVAYRLLTGRLPRGQKAWSEQLEKAQLQVTQGLPYEIDSKALLEAVKAQPEVSWPVPAESEWEQQRREVIERALHSRWDVRWRDMREVMREFEVLEATYLLEESRAQTEAEKVKQAARVKSLSRTTMGLVALLTVATVYAGVTLLRAHKVEGEMATIEAFHQADVQSKMAGAVKTIGERDLSIEGLGKERDEARAAKALADVNLKRSQLAVDQFLTQLLQGPASSPQEVEFSRAQMEEALAFYQQSLPEMEARPELVAERVRAYGNIGRIFLKLRRLDEAGEMLQKALLEAAKLQAAAGNAESKVAISQSAGRYGLMLAELKQQRGDSEAAFELLKEAAPQLQEGLTGEGGNAMARTECALAWLELGARSFERGELKEARAALGRVGVVLDAGVERSDMAPDDAFLLARAGFELGLVTREEGKHEEALTQMIDAVRSMGELVMGSSPRNQDQALALAEAYTVLSELVGQHFSGKDALDAHEQAVPILLELNRLHPEWAEVKYFLARNNGAIAQLERDLGQTADVMRKKEDAIALVNEVLADDKDNGRYLALQAQLRHEYAGFLADAGKAVEAVGVARLAEATLKKLLAGQEGKMTPERKQRWVLLAQCQGLLAHSLEKAGKKEEAKEGFGRSLESWQKLEAAGATEDLVKQGVAWTQDRIAKIK